MSAMLLEGPLLDMFRCGDQIKLKSGRLDRYHKGWAVMLMGELATFGGWEVFNINFFLPQKEISHCGRAGVGE